MFHKNRAVDGMVGGEADGVFGRVPLALTKQHHSDSFAGLRVVG